jgi:hypothetical protein
MNSTAPQFAPDPAAIRRARIALEISFTAISLLGGAFVFAGWVHTSAPEAILRTLLLVVIMGCVHVVGYRLWLSQGSRGSSDTEGLSPQIAFDQLISALKTGLIWQLGVLVLNGLLLDDGGAFQIALRTCVGYFAGVVLIFTRFMRRKTAPTKLDLIFIRYGSLICLYIVVPLIGLLQLLLQYLGVLPEFLRLRFAR